MKIVVLATDSPSTWMMVNALSANYPSLQVVIEQPVSRFFLLRRRVAKIGYFRVFGQILFMLFITIMKRISRNHIRHLIATVGLSDKKPIDVPIFRFDSVNSQACIDWLELEKPDVVVINGTRIVSQQLLSSCKAVFLNTHCGITPAYRGVHGGYWALVRGDKNNVGVTVHLVDAGVDTGGIVFQGTIKIDEQDNFLTYPIKQYIAGIPLMRRAIADAISGKLQTRNRDDLPSVIWHHPTLWQYWWVRLWRGVR